MVRYRDYIVRSLLIERLGKDEAMPVEGEYLLYTQFCILTYATIFRERKHAYHDTQLHSEEQRQDSHI